MDVSTNQSQSEKTSTKKNSTEHGIFCLEKIIGLETQRIKLFNNNTAYDSYMDFLQEAKNEIPITKLRETFPNDSNFATHEMILTPTFVCYLAMKKLRNLLEIDQLPDFRTIPEPPMTFSTDPKNEATSFHPDSRDLMADSLHNYIQSMLTELDLQNQVQ